MDTEVVGVPKGSGLGTSSILAAACVKALYAFTGTPCTDQDIYSRVLAMEQIMSTGGGWQDQVGGLTPGIKFITTMPGVVQDIHVEPVRMTAGCLKELDSQPDPDLYRAEAACQEPATGRSGAVHRK